ncbi:MAG: hypothetical protein RMM53_13930, partial [Bacteroidia bacterium]|nr:hypothetical protein [Bacteroidia bacterium]
NPVASPAATTTYTVTGTDANGCVSTATTTVAVNAPPTLTATSSAPYVCLGQSATLTATGASSYVWQPANQIQGPNAGTSVVARPDNTTVYTVTGTDDNGCVSQRTLTLNVVPNPEVSVVADRTEICAGQASAQLTAAGASSYVWQPATGLNNPNVANPVANPASTTTYTVTGTTAAGCTDVETITIVVRPLPTVSITTGPTTICVGQNTTLSASGATSYRWEPTAGLSDANIANPVASPAVTTAYTVFGTDANGCVSTATATIFVSPLPSVSAVAS